MIILIVSSIISSWIFDIIGCFLSSDKLLKALQGFFPSSILRTEIVKRQKKDIEEAKAHHGEEQEGHSLKNLQEMCIINDNEEEKLILFGRVHSRVSSGDSKKMLKKLSRVAGSSVGGLISMFLYVLIFEEMAGCPQRGEEWQCYEIKRYSWDSRSNMIHDNQVNCSLALNGATLVNGTEVDVDKIHCLRMGWNLAVAIGVGSGSYKLLMFGNLVTAKFVSLFHNIFVRYLIIFVLTLFHIALVNFGWWYGVPLGLLWTYATPSASIVYTACTYGLSDLPEKPGTTVISREKKDD